MKTALSLGLMIISGSALASAPNSELTVSGTIKTPSCTVTSSNSGTYEFGQISASTLGRSETALPPVTQTYTVVCDASTYLTFKTVDNRSNSVSSPSATKFGLGRNVDGYVGYYTGKVKNATVDGDKSKVMRSQNTSFVANDEVDLTNNPAEVIGWAESNNVLKLGTSFAADVEITPYLSKASEFGDIVGDVQLDGSATMNFAFGI